MKYRCHAYPNIKIGDVQFENGVAVVTSKEDAELLSSVSYVELVKEPAKPKAKVSSRAPRATQKKESK